MPGRKRVVRRDWTRADVRELRQHSKDRTRVKPSLEGEPVEKTSPNKLAELLRKELESLFDGDQFEEDQEAEEHPWIAIKGPEAGPFLCNLDLLIMLGGLLMGLPG